MAEKLNRRVKNVHLILNDCVGDSRLLREAAAIAEVLADGEAVEVIGAVKGAEDNIAVGPNVTIRRLALKPGTGPAGKLTTAIRLVHWCVRALARSLKCHRGVLNVHHAELLPLALISASLTRSQIVYVPHELEPERAGQAALKSRAIAWIERFSWPRLGSVVAVNDSIAEEYHQRYGGRRPIVVENVQASAPFSGHPVNLRSLADVRTSQKICLYVGALVHGRGIEGLLDYFVASDQKEFVLVFLGRGTLRGAIEEAARKVETIRILDPVSPAEVPAYVAGADVSAVIIEGVSRSYELALPNKFFESIAGGVPVVATPLVELKRFVQAYSVGVCIEAKTARDFFEGCQAACAIPRTIFQEGQRRLFAEHGWQVQKKRITETYKSARQVAETA